jgi:hypothetical protein
MSSDSKNTITLANQHFTIGQSSDDKLRRDQYFRNPEQPEYQLTDDERKVLLAVGIDGILESTLRPYLAKFFDVLPSCQTDAAMMLAKNCEVPYYVIWSARFGARQGAKGRFEENKRNHKSRTNIQMAENGAYIDDLKPLPVIPDTIRDIFTLITVAQGAPAPNNGSTRSNLSTGPQNAQASDPMALSATTASPESKYVKTIREVFTSA